DGTFSHLAEVLEEAGIGLIGPAFALHHRAPVSTADLEVGFPVDTPLTGTLTLPSGYEVTGSVPPAGRVGWISHIGGYGGLAREWGAVAEGLGEAEEPRTDPLTEVAVTPPEPGSNPAAPRPDSLSPPEPRAAGAAHGSVQPAGAAGRLNDALPAAQHVWPPRPSMVRGRHGRAGGDGPSRISTVRSRR